MRNYSLRDGEQPPVWMVLKYLLTAFDDDEKSDTIEAHELLAGRASRRCTTRIFSRFKAIWSR